MVQLVYVLSCAAMEVSSTRLSLVLHKTGEYPKVCEKFYDQLRHQP